MNKFVDVTAELPGKNIETHQLKRKLLWIWRTRRWPFSLFVTYYCSLSAFHLAPNLIIKTPSRKCQKGNARQMVRGETISVFEEFFENVGKDSTISTYSCWRNSQIMQGTRFEIIEMLQLKATVRRPAGLGWINESSQATRNEPNTLTLLKWGW